MASKDEENVPLIPIEGEGHGTIKKSLWALRGLMLIGLVVTAIGISVSIEGCGGASAPQKNTLQFNSGDASSSNITFEFIAEEGALITSLKLGDANIIIDAPFPSGFYGSTFWPSPQSAWDWPPPEVIANNTYDYDNTSSDTRVILMSQPDESTGIQVTKDFSLDTERKAIILKYTFEGLNETEVKYAGWEKTSVPPGGLTFWKEGKTAPLHPLYALPIINNDDGITYIDYVNANITDKGVKVMSNTTSKFIAHATNTTFFMKVFKSVDADEVAPGEGNVEYFATKRVVSLENQGPYMPTKKGSPVTYVVCWYVRPLPDGAFAAVGNKALLDLVDAIEQLGCPSA